VNHLQLLFFKQERRRAANSQEVDSKKALLDSYQLSIEVKAQDDTNTSYE